MRKNKHSRLSDLRRGTRVFFAIGFLSVGSALVSSCSMMSSSGPSSRAVRQSNAQDYEATKIRVVEVTNDVARRVIASNQAQLFSDTFGQGMADRRVVGLGDILDVSIWEAPPAALFGSAGADVRLSAASTSIARGTALPEQMVDAEGHISIPFAGAISALGKTPETIARDIQNRLARKAHEPQVIVRIVRNSASNVTVVGDVASSGQVPLTTKGERVLDVLASAGGVRQPVGKMTVQISRGTRLASLPLEMVIRDPRQNIQLQANDIVTLLFQPFSFTALGAAGANAEVPFEGTGLTLAQALGRVGGLQDIRADAKGVFIFRLEDPAAVDPSPQNHPSSDTNGKIPVIYKIDMKDPSTLFVAQKFPIRDKDILYVSNAPSADFQKFLNIVSSVVYPIISVEAITKNN